MPGGFRRLAGAATVALAGSAFALQVAPPNATPPAAYVVDCDDVRTCVRVLAPEDFAVAERLREAGTLARLLAVGGELPADRELYLDGRQSALVVRDCPENIARLHRLLESLCEFAVPWVETTYELTEEGAAAIGSVLGALVDAGDECGPRVAWSLDGRTLEFSGPPSRVVALTDALGERGLLVRDEGLAEFRERLFPFGTLPATFDARAFADAQAAAWRALLAEGGPEWAGEGRGRTVRMDWDSCELVARDFPDRIAKLSRASGSMGGVMPRSTLVSKVVFLDRADPALVAAELGVRYGGLRTRAERIENLDAVYFCAHDRAVLADMDAFAESMDRGAASVE